MSQSLNLTQFNSDLAHLVIAAVILDKPVNIRINIHWPPGTRYSGAVEERLHKLASPYGQLIGFELNRAIPKQRKEKVLPCAFELNQVEFGWYRELNAYVPLQVVTSA